MDSSHLVPIADGWAMWKWVWLRGTGFPASMLLELASPDIARTIDALLDARASAQRARDEAVAEIQLALDAASSDMRDALVRAVKQVRRGLVPPVGVGAGSALETFRAKAEELGSREAAATAAVAAEYARISDAVRKIARDTPFREAVLWQNRHVLLTAVDPVVRHEGPGDSKVRQHERTIAMYLQRYCSKNDTIGFFGPVAWATVSNDATVPTTLRQGPGLLAKRTVYFEHWAVDALAQTLAADPEIKPHLAPRRMPAIRVDGTTLYHSGGEQIDLPDAYAVLLAACDGMTPASKLAETLLSDEELGLSDESEVYELLDQLVAKRMATWTIEIPVGKPFPEAELSRILEGIPDEQVRARAMSRLQTLVAARDEVASSAGDVPRLERALAALESSFHEVTGRDPTRKHGEMYAGRTLSYEDCVRDLSCTIAQHVFGAVGEPLSLLLLSARWLTAQVAQRCLVLANEVFDRLRGAGDTVDYLQFWAAIGPAITAATGQPELVRASASELQAKWEAILMKDVRPGERRIERTFEELAPLVRESFAADGPGWTLARFHAPDMMLAADSIEAIAEGRFLMVLGELHAAVNSLFSQIAMSQNAEVDAFYRASAADLPGITISPVESKQFATRADYQPLKPGDFQLEIGETRASFPRSHVLAIGEMLVAREGSTLVLRTADATHQFELMALLGNYLTVKTISSFKILPHTGHTPRVSIGKLVIERERWTFDAQEITFCGEKESLARFSGARRWIREHGLPRFVFVKVAEEPKPFYVDFESVIYVDILAHKVRRATKVMITEMLPGMNELWLRNEQGDAYTTEIRTAFLDPIPYAPPR